MNYTEKQNNKVYILGKILTKAVFSHEVYGEGFYEMNVSVKRLSGQCDILPVIVAITHYFRPFLSISIKNNHSCFVSKHE